MKNLEPARRVLALALSLFLAMGLMPLSAASATGGGSPSGAVASPTDWSGVRDAIATMTNGVIDLTGLTAGPNDPMTFNVGDNKTLTLKGSGTLIENVAFVFGANNSITIENLNIKSADDHKDSATYAVGYSPLHFTGAGNILTLVGENIVTSGQINTEERYFYGAAVGVPAGAALTVAAASTQDNITANGGFCGASIGGGRDSDGGSISINGGTVTANGGDYSSGIGGGYRGSGGTISISGGTVIAKGGSYGAGIGGGSNKGGGTITISGGTVAATGGYCGAGIGGGDWSDGDRLTISGGTVTATGGDNGAGIGGGRGGKGSTATIDGGTVSAIGSSNAHNIGRGSGSEYSGSLTNGASKPVFLNILTISGAANTPVSDASYGAPATAYGTKDVKTDSDGKLYFYLPASAANEVVSLTAGSVGYAADYTRANNHANAEFMKLGLQNATITITGSLVYTGTALEPAITVMLGGETLLQQGAHYTVSYEGNRTNAGDSGKVIVTGMGSYIGKVEKSFTVVSAGGGGYIPPAESVVYNNPSQLSATVWLSGGGLTAGDMLVTQALTRGSDYNALIRLADKDDILRVYDISLKNGKRAGTAMHLTFALGSEYAGQTFTLVHKKADGTFEYFHATADAKGHLKFGPLYELSPFMLVKGTLPQTGIGIPKTGDKSNALHFAFLALAVLCGAGAVVYKKKRMGA